MKSNNSILRLLAIYLSIDNFVTNIPQVYFRETRCNFSIQLVSFHQKTQPSIRSFNHLAIIFSPPYDLSQSFERTFKRIAHTTSVMDGQGRLPRVKSIMKVGCTRETAFERGSPRNDLSRNCAAFVIRFRVISSLERNGEEIKRGAAIPTDSPWRFEIFVGNCHTVETSNKWATQSFV